MEFNIADLFEHAVDTWPDREYLVANGERRTYAEMEARANRLAHHLAAQGIGAGDHVGIYALNSVQWVETLWAVFKLRAVWININYRYVEEELAYLFDNADLKALVHSAEYSERVAKVRGNLPLLQHTLVIEDDYEAALAAQSPERDFGPRSADDRYILFTGGTTGMPKGVVWRHEDVIFALGGGIDLMTGERKQRPEEFVEKGKAGNPMTSLPIAPLMHGATQWGVMSGSFLGNKIVLVDKFEPDRVWKLVGEERVNMVMITGDAMARPLYDAFSAAPDAYDVSSLFAFGSTAALFSTGLKDAYLDLFPNIVITDSVGSSEGGANGTSMVSKGQLMKGGPTVRAAADAYVLDDELRIVEPGSGVRGRLARTGNLPIGYHRDPEKTAQTFVTGADGRRYVIPGDFAMLEADGTITLLGRGSVSINSGGEKIFPEEVENAVRSHPAVFDAVVVGLPDERWGESVAAVVMLRPDTVLELEDLQQHARQHIAGYKVPRHIVLVDHMERSPSGKPDYRWAKQQAVDSLGPPT